LVDPERIEGQFYQKFGRKKERKKFVAMAIVVRPFFMFFIGMVYFSSGCTPSPKSHEAEVGAPVKAIPAETEAVAYEASINKTVLEWVGTKPLGRHIGRIGFKEGMVYVKSGSIVGGKFVFDMNDIDIIDLEGERKEKLYNHLLSKDFFDVQRFPEATFELVDIGLWQGDSTKKLDDAFVVDKPTHEILGNLTLRGKTLGVKFPATVTVNDSTFLADANFNIDRTLWGVSYHSESSVEAIAKDNLIHDEVNISIHLVAAKLSSGKAL
jgi:hypothetical protein